MKFCARWNKNVKEHDKNKYSNTLNGAVNLSQNFVNTVKKKNIQNKLFQTKK